MRNIDSDALSQVQRQLGISGIGSGQAVLEDDELRQVLDVGPAVRRGRADVANGGWFWGVLVNDHEGAGDLTSFIDPYNVTAAFQLTSYPVEVDVSRFDIWVTGVSAVLTAGEATIVEAQFGFGGPLRSLAFSKDDDGATVALTGANLPLARWQGIAVDLGQGVQSLVNTGEPYFPIKLRMPRGSQMVFLSRSVGISTYQCQILMGLFPIGLGQDVFG